MAANSLKSFVNAQDSTRNRFISQNKEKVELGQAGYDNVRDVIDPQIRTNFIQAELAKFFTLRGLNNIPVIGDTLFLSGAIFINRSTDVGNKAPMQVRNLLTGTNGEWVADYGTVTSTSNAFVAVRNKNDQAMIFGIRGTQPFVQGFGASAFRVEQGGGSLGNMEVNNIEGANITGNNLIVNTGGVLNLTNIAASEAVISANSTNQTPETQWIQDGATGNYEVDRPPYGWLRVNVDETIKYIPVWD